MEKVRIKDIAAIAGVSPGTVDRVIHNRGNVSEKARQRVLEVMQELNYQPNIIASTLAYNRTFRLAIMTPSPKHDSYWELPYSGITKAWNNVKHYGVVIDEYFYHPRLEASFQARAKQVLQDRPDAILLAAETEKESLDFIHSCLKKNIQCMLINTLLESPDIIGYVGQDSFQSGILAAKLLSSVIGTSDYLLIIHAEEYFEQSRHLVEKELGFRQFMEQHGNPKVEHLVFNNHQEDYIQMELSDFVNQHGVPGGIFVSNSRGHLIAQALNNLNIHTNIVGFDLIEPNIRLLNEGSILYLINQNAELQGYYALMSIVNKCILKKEVPARHFLPIDIVVPENVSYYLDTMRWIT